MPRSAYEAPQLSNTQWVQEMRDGELKIGCAINTSSPLCAEMCAAIGYDFLLIDQQHSAIDPEKLRTLITACHAGGAKSIVRVGGAYDRIGIQQALDLGSDGILIPCSRTVEDVKHAVSCAKYPVHGPGSDGGSRSVYVNLRPQLPGGFPNLFEYANKKGNESTIIAAQIETKDALECVEDICKVPGLDIAFIGPGDLCVGAMADMGLAREVGLPACFADPRFAAAEDRVAAACKDSGCIFGYWNSSIADKGAKGCRLMVVDGDIHAMQAALTTSFAEKKKIKEDNGYAGKSA